MFDFLVQDWSYLGIICFLVLTGCGLPIPEEVPIVLAGVLSAKPDGLDPYLAYTSCLVGALVGDAVMYGIGYRWGHGLLKDHPKFARFLHAEREERFERAIQNHGLKVLLVARFMVGVRGPVYLAAGVARISFRRFVLMDLLAATLVVSLFFGLSYTFGPHISAAMRRLEITLTVVIVMTLLALAIIIYWRRRRMIAQAVLVHASRDGDQAPSEGFCGRDEYVGFDRRKPSSVPSSQQKSA
jgi:membrane protein DedA with SNARE-associated domain